MYTYIYLILNFKSYKDTIKIANHLMGDGLDDNRKILIVDNKDTQE